MRVRAGGQTSQLGSTTELGKPHEIGAVALAVRTGFNTTKGKLIRSMLFPKPNSIQQL